jgi:dual specificity phosphatase 12
VRQKAETRQQKSNRGRRLITTSPEQEGATTTASTSSISFFFSLVGFVDAMNDEALGNETCRILVIGAHRARLEKVIALLRTNKNTEAANNCGETTSSKQIVRIEYLACVAKFDSYKDEAGTLKRYLASVKYYPHGPDGILSSSPASLLPFFDEEEGNDACEGGPRFHGVAGAAIGSGIEGQENTACIDAFLKTMMSASMKATRQSPKLKTIEPNAGYASMQDELAAYKALTAEEKDEATRLGTMGPAKMQKFASDFATELIRAARGDDSSTNTEKPLSLSLTNDANKNTGTDTMSASTNAPPPLPIDSEKNRFACRKCRTILFGEAALQDPPHEPSRHSFSYRKQHHGACYTTSEINDSCCQSYFLQDSLDWMRDDIRKGYPEGKFSCPVCDSKLGNWIWSGTQCSCGTWVVPAIQIPKSKVDVVPPRLTLDRNGE